MAQRALGAWPRAGTAPSEASATALATSEASATALSTSLCNPHTLALYPMLQPRSPGADLLPPQSDGDPPPPPPQMPPLVTRYNAAGLKSATAKGLAKSGPCDTLVRWY